MVKTQDRGCRVTKSEGRNPFSLVVKIARLLDYPEYYFYTVDDDMAKNMLEVHRNRVNPEENLQYYTLEENKNYVNRMKKPENY